MDSSIIDDLLNSLGKARWETAFRTFGNSHATLIGILVDWWTSSDPATRWALEGGPSFGYNAKGIGGGICDAVLGEGDRARGVVEVEGTRYISTIEKIGKFFSSKKNGLQNLDFGVFPADAYAPQGVDPARQFVSLPLDDFVGVGKVEGTCLPGRTQKSLVLWLWGSPFVGAAGSAR